MVSADYIPKTSASDRSLYTTLTHTHTHTLAIFQVNMGYPVVPFFLSLRSSLFWASSQGRPKLFGPTVYFRLYTAHINSHIKWFESRYFSGWILSLSANQQHQSTEAIRITLYVTLTVLLMLMLLRQHLIVTKISDILMHFKCMVFYIFIFTSMLTPASGG